MTKNHLVTMTLLSIGLMSTIPANALTTTRTIREPIVDSSKMSNTVVLDVPYATDIKSINVDNGKVTYQYLDVAKGRLTITVSNGATNDLWNPKKESDYVTDTVTVEDKYDLDTYIDYSYNKYSGTLKLLSTTNSTLSKSVSGTAVIGIDYYFECLSPGTLKENPSYDPKKADNNSNPKYTYSGANWSSAIKNTSFDGVVNDDNWSANLTNGPSVSRVTYSDRNGYEGTGTYSLSKSSTQDLNYDKYMPTPGNGWTLPTRGQHVRHKYERYDYKLSATAYKPKYIGNYGGTVYKGGYDKVYSYNITVNYEEDLLNVNLSVDNSSWTNQPINIIATSNSDFFYYFTQGSNKKYSNPSYFSVSSNGTYTVSATDSGHGQYTRTASKSITVKNIDTTTPSGSFSPSSRNNWDGDLKVLFTPSDSGGSGVKEWRYCTSSDNGVTYSAYSGYYTTSQSILLNTDGKNKIKVEVKDVAGNVNIVYSGIYLVDKNPPVLTFLPNGCDWRNTKTTSTWSAIDTGSLVKGYSYRINTVNNSLKTSTSFSSNSISNTKTDITAEGLNYLEVEAVDNAGNAKTYTSNPFKIDYTVPTLDIESEDFIADTFIDIPIKLKNVVDNLSGVSNIEVSLFEDFSQKVEITNVNTDYYPVELPRYGLSFEQTIYVRVTDVATNSIVYTKDVYLDPLPPEVPNVTGVEKDNLIINNEKVKIEWDYKDPGSFKLAKTILIFTDKETNKTYTHTIEGELLEATLEPSIPVGVYNLTVEVYNTENKFTQSTEEIQIRKNRFITKGNLYTEEITTPGNNIKYVKVNLDYSRQNLSENGKKYLADSKTYIILPELDGTFNLKNPTVKLEYKENTKNEAFKIPGGAIDKIIIAIENNSTDVSYSRITPWLDSISVSVR